MIERHPTTDGALHPLRPRDVTASVAPALFGLHPRRTIGGLYLEKKFGLKVDRDDETAAMRRGRIMEPSVAVAVREDRPGWIIQPAREYLRDPVRRLGATPDFYYRDDQSRRGVLQAKTVSKFVFDRHWGESPPTWIALQTATEMMLDDAEVGCIAALIVDGYHFDCVLFDVDRHHAAEKRIRDAVAKFWANVAAGVQPAIDYKRDGDLIKLMYPVEISGKTVDLRGDNRLPELLADRARLLATIKEAEDAKELIDNELKSKVGDAEAALVPGWRITLKTTHRKERVMPAASWRALRVTAEIGEGQSKEVVKT